MVVVVIIGILVAIAIPIYGTITEGAEQSAVEANLRTIDGGIMMYRADYGDFPDGVHPDNEDDDGLEEDIDQLSGYVEEFDPAGGEEYGITSDGENSYFYLPSGESVGGMDGDDTTTTLPVDWD